MRLKALAACAALMAVAACGDEPATEYEAEILRSAYGVPHIIASDHGGLGFGLGFAAAQDNICEIAERTITVRGQRAAYLGPGPQNANIASDLFHRGAAGEAVVEAYLNGPAGDVDTPSAEARAFVAGMAAGVNRYLADTGIDAISDPRCRGADWVRALSESDIWLSALIAPFGNPIAAIANAAPPSEPDSVTEARLDPDLNDVTMGSNAYGLGREATRSGRGAVLGNPHYPWNGALRFYRSHLIIPGELNVAGAGLITSPFPGIGHTGHIAWSHTVSTARRFGYFELTLDREDPTRYLVDGEYRDMTRQDVTLDVMGDDGVSSQITRTLYSTEFGPLAVSDQMPWSDERAYAWAAPSEGLRVIDQYFAIWAARDVGELHEALGRYQATGFNTIAADSAGLAYHGDMGMVPHVTEDLIAECAVSQMARGAWASMRIAVLDASRPQCRWGSDGDSTRPGVFGPSSAPHIFRQDWVAQSNDSHWLSQPAAPMTGFSPIYGDETGARSLRTRLAIDMIEQRLAGSDGLGEPGFDLETLTAAMYSNRHHGGELVRDDLAALCRNEGGDDLQPVCDALEGWDLRVDRDSRGVLLFNLFIEAGGLKWIEAFDPADPVRTPHTLDVTDPAVLEALRTAAARLEALEIAPDARLGDVQAEMRGEERIEIHGANRGTGVFNMIVPEPPRAGEGSRRIIHGSSWIMAVEFTDEGPRSRGILTYSQSTNRASPHYGDQTRLYSDKGWDELYFEEEAARANAVSRVRIRQ
ncbi:acylase [Alkalicaulis satelles]|uniref:Acylase n=1 Tax=Alkalicaulis satelles TaxID=2609175 RepID=A0A5M6ZQ27_9PROT|nr:penicillin acylase family protein [Alkalicaulis satelles]KAA5805358.1 acylase [Alkalicaulis satelles]